MSLELILFPNNIVFEIDAFILNKSIYCQTGVSIFT